MAAARVETFAFDASGDLRGVLHREAERGLDAVEAGQEGDAWT
jgi:hypothetical protein